MQERECLGAYEHHYHLLLELRDQRPRHRAGSVNHRSGLQEAPVSLEELHGEAKSDWFGSAQVRPAAPFLRSFDLLMIGPNGGWSVRPPRMPPPSFFLEEAAVNRVRERSPQAFYHGDEVAGRPSISTKAVLQTSFAITQRHFLCG